MAPEWQAVMQAFFSCARRPDDVCPHRCHEGSTPSRGSRVQSIAQEDALGTAQVGTRPLALAAIVILIRGRSNCRKKRFSATEAETYPFRKLLDCDERDVVSNNPIVA